MRIGDRNFGINQQSGSVSLVWTKFSTELDGERDFSSGFRPERDYRSLTLLSQTRFNTGLGHTSVLLAYGDKPYGADQFYRPFPSRERTESWVAGIKQDLGSDRELDFGFRRHTDEFVLFRGQPSIYENNHIDESWQADLRRHQALSKNRLCSTAPRAFTKALPGNNLGDHERSRGALYLDYDARMETVLLFGRGPEEIFSASHGELSPTIAAGVWLNTRLKLKGSVSRAFRPPSDTDLYYQDPDNLGNPYLRPESAWDYDAAWNGARRDELRSPFSSSAIAM